MGGRARARRAAAGLGVVGLLCAVVGAVLIAAVPPLIRQMVLKNVRIDPNSLSFNMWKEIPVPFYLSVYFFDVVNPNEILKGEKPQVRERGPYVYREFRHKKNITFNDNDTVSFLEHRSFQFQPDKSRGSESDYIVIPNILVLAASFMMEHRPMSLKLIMTLAFSALGQRAFMNRTVGEIMWGYEDPLMNLINKYLPGVFPFKDKFGLFAEMNDSDSGVFTVFTGVKDFSRIHLVDKWNGLSKVHEAHLSEARGVRGHPHLSLRGPQNLIRQRLHVPAQRGLLPVPGLRNPECEHLQVRCTPVSLPPSLLQRRPGPGRSRARPPPQRRRTRSVPGHPPGHRDPHELLREAAAEPLHESHQGHRANREDRACGAAADVVWGERGHGGRDAQHVLHPAGAAAQRAAVRTVRPPGAGLRPAARPCHLPSPQPGSPAEPGRRPGAARRPAYPAPPGLALRTARRPHGLTPAATPLSAHLPLCCRHSGMHLSPGARRRGSHSTVLEPSLGGTPPGPSQLAVGIVSCPG
ncbi:scavenger receptor class B member 1 isoform X1 [Oryctolagus cuniculus]|uniref:scavenger receptor class B member 1 isoform X1 n=1 Tax=Oryctolagus cuniculus TaxID=9986 RepID=UPI0038795942